MKYPARALLGYMPKEEAVQLLAGGPIREDDIPKFEDVWRRYAKAAEARGVFESVEPLVAPPTELIAEMEAFANRPDVATLMQPHDWAVAFVDISREVLTYQRLVISRDIEERIGNLSQQDYKSLLAICLPPPQASQMLGAFDPAQMAFTATSVNPNLRIAGFEVASVSNPQSSQPQQLLGFRISMGSTFVQIVEYKGRWMVRDGYHRLYGLLTRGITQVPCVVIRAKTFEETGAAQPGFFSFETLFGPYPPRITDFLNDQFSVNVEVQANMRVIRIKAEQFFVPIHEVGSEQ